MGEQRGGRQFQEALGFFEEELGFVERFVADVLPTNESLRVDEEGAMERHFFEIIVGAIGFEDVQLFVRNDLEGEAIAGFALGKGLVQAFDGVGADGDHRDAGGLELASHRREKVELLDAMDAAVAEIKDDEHRPAAEIAERDFLVLRIVQNPIPCG